MSDQFNQKPEDDLPDWLKELRNRGSLEGDDSQLEEFASADSTEIENKNEELPSEDSIEEKDRSPEDMAVSNDEPDWLKDIRERHQQDSESQIKPKAEETIPQDSDAKDLSTVDQEKDEDEQSRWAAPDETAPSPTPILEVPAEPTPTDAAKPISAENDNKDDDQEEAEESFKTSVDPEKSTVVTESFEDAFANAFPDHENPQENSIDEDTAKEEEVDLSESQEDTPTAIEANDEDGEGNDWLSSNAFVEENDAPIHQSNNEESGTLESSIADEISPDSDEGFIDEVDSGLALEQFLAQGSEPESPEDSDSAKGENEEQVSAFGNAEQKDIAPAELPSWLATLKPGSQPNNEPPADEKASEYDLNDESEAYSEGQERVGPLAGLSGIIPAEPEVVQMGRSKIPTDELTLNENQEMHVANLEKLLAKEGAPIEDQGQRIALPMRFMQLLFATVLILATLFPLLNGSQIASRAPLGSIPESTSFFNQIELLPPDIPVLVAFEVQPALYGEMKALATTVLDHLLDKQTRLVFISTQATGPALVEKLLAEELNAQPSIASGDYVNLGYLSGGTAALRYFASNPRQATLLPQQWQASSLESIQSVSNFGVVLTITGDAEDARAWIEQVSPLTSDGLFILSSAQAAPLLLPYLDSDPVTVRSIVSGLNGAAYYENLRNRDGLGRDYWDAYSYGLGAIVILILLGSLYGRLIQLRPEPTKADPNAN